MQQALREPAAIWRLFDPALPAKSAEAKTLHCIPLQSSCEGCRQNAFRGWKHEAQKHQEIFNRATRCQEHISGTLPTCVVQQRLSFAWPGYCEVRHRGVRSRLLAGLSVCPNCQIIHTIILVTCIANYLSHTTAFKICIFKSFWLEMMRCLYVDEPCLGDNIKRKMSIRTVLPIKDNLHTLQFTSIVFWGK